MTIRTCPGCGGKISRGAQLCSECRKRAIVAGVNLLAPGARADPPAPKPGVQTPGQNRAYHAKCSTIARATGEQPTIVKRAVLEKASSMFRRDITSSKAMNEDEMSRLLDHLDEAIATATED